MEKLITNKLTIDEIQTRMNGNTPRSWYITYVKAKSATDKNSRDIYN